jgi:alkanesulfonate monooxygenase SsuD/methylene tetrahydromethanopterin reductase-like flavin-dependent oxidoreductase (luciferase family)
VSYSLSLYGNDPDHILRLASAADRLGFDRIWLGEHVVAPLGFETEHPYGEAGRPTPVTAESRLYDVWLLAGMILGATTELEVATGVLQLPLRHPLLTARAVASAWELSGGRFMLGVGVGWMAEEYAALDVPFSERGRRYGEILDILQSLLAGGPVEHHGDHYEFDRLTITDKSLPVPLVFGGTSAVAYRRAAVRGDGWYNPGTSSLADCVVSRASIEAIRREHGLVDPFTYHVRLKGGVEPPDLARYHDAGFESLVIPWQALWSATDLDITLEAKLHALERTAAMIGLVPRG